MYFLKNFCNCCNRGTYRSNNCISLISPVILGIFLSELMEANGHYRFTLVVTIEKLWVSVRLSGLESESVCVSLMFTSKTANFCKNEDCPSSQELLDFQNGDLDRERAVDVRLHTSSCEFCSAEVEFYSIYPQANEELFVEPAKIPAPLFELAEAILKNRESDHRSLNMLLRETEGLVSR